MHIPDGFLDGKTAAVTAVISTVSFAFALRQSKKRMQPRKIPLMGVAAAFVFAAQMVNFPVGAGTSGHLVGAVLTAVLLGPSAALIVITSVLIVQALLFADGGLTALGANVFNMAVIGSVGGYAVFRLVRKLVPGERGFYGAVAFASWISTVLASVCVAGELAWSGTVAWSAGFPAMANVHMIIGLGEALITSLVIAAVARTRKDLLDTQGETIPLSQVVVYGLALALGLALFVSPFASQWPDGLEKVASMLGFEQHTVASPAAASPIAGYHIRGFDSTAATALAGAIGTIVVFGLSFLLARLLAPKPSLNQD